jgi:beta-glucosidase
LPRFPDGFLFGVATSAFQLDGGGGLADWDDFPARSGDRPGRATGHRDVVQEDLDLLTSLGANACRLSLDWPRLEPEPDRWDEEEWGRVVAELKGLRARGIAPMLTLLHFALPRWLAAQGGLEAPGFARRLGLLAGEAARRLGALVELWCPINEPNVHLFQGYIEGVWPPAARDPARAGRAWAGVLRGHSSAAMALRTELKDARIGVALNLIRFEPASAALLPDWIAAGAAERAFNWAFLDSIAQGRARLSLPGVLKVNEEVPGLAGSLDWLGVNYYTRYLIRFDPRAPGWVRRSPGPGPLTDLGWEIDPRGLLAVLRAAAARTRLPLYVTENGLADAGGARRGAFLRDHLWAIARALREGVDVRGYFHWSLIDNFEWADGFAPRFGLYRVDYSTLQRSPNGAEEFTALLREARR